MLAAPQPVVATVWFSQLCFHVSARPNGLGETVTWEATRFGIRQRLTSTITAYNRPRQFRDEMVKGAFSYIRHDHFFEENNGMTTMIDRFDFGSPLGILSRLANSLVLTHYLRKLIGQRNALIKQYAESGKWMGP